MNRPEPKSDRARGNWKSRLVLLAALVLFVFLVGGGSAWAAQSGAAGGKAVDPALAGVASQIHHEYSLWKQFLFSYLTACMFCLSICLGSLFLVILNHLFDASWSTPLRRFLEHIAASVWILGVMFIPILLFAPQIYGWMNVSPEADHALFAKKVLFNRPMWTLVSIGLFVLWWFLANKLRSASIAQDQDGAAVHTYTMRKWAAGGIFLFALSLTLGAIFWMKSIQHAWFSTMYGVYYFAGSVWTSVATAYVLTLKFKNGRLREVVHKRQFHDLGVLFFAFTVFYAYIHFSQYFLIWNAAIPEETFWYVLRENGSWWDIGMLIVFGHFFLPFLCLLRVDAKLSSTIMVPMVLWAWIMHYLDMQYNVMPALHPKGYKLHIFDLICIAFVAIVLYRQFMKSYAAHAPYPLRDPRLKEALTHHEIPAAPQSAAHSH